MAIDPISLLVGIGTTIVGGFIKSGQRNAANRRRILDEIKARDVLYEREMASWKDTTRLKTEAHAEFYGARKGQAERVAIAQIADSMQKRGELKAQAQEYAFGTTEIEATQVAGGRGIRGYATHGVLVSSGTALARLEATRSRGAEGVRRLEAKADFVEKRGELAAAMTRESVIEPKLVLDPEPFRQPVAGEESVTAPAGGTEGTEGAEVETEEVTLDQYGVPETAIGKKHRLIREKNQQEAKDLSAFWAGKNQYRNQKRDMESKLGRDLTTQEKVNLQRKTKVDPEDLWRAKQLQSAILHRYPDTSEKGIGEPPPTGLQKFTRELAYGITGALEDISGGAIKKLGPPKYERTYIHQIQDADDSWYDPLMFDPTEGGNQPGYRPVSEGTRIRRELGLIDTDKASRGLSLLNRLGSRDLKRIHDRLTKGGGSWTEGGALGHKISDISAEWDVIAAAEELGINIMQDPNFEETQASERSAAVNESGHWDKNWLQRHHDMVRSGQITYEDEDLARRMGLMPPTEEEEAAAQARADRRDEESDILASSGTYMSSDLLMFTDEEEYLRQQEDLYSREHGLFRGKASDFIESDEFIEQEEPRAIAAGLTSAMEDEIFADLQYFDMGGAFDVQSVVDVKEDSLVDEPEEDRTVVDRGTTGLSTVQQVEDPTKRPDLYEDPTGLEIGAEPKEEIVASTTTAAPTATVGGVLKSYTAPTTTVGMQPEAGSDAFDELAGIGFTSHTTSETKPEPEDNTFKNELYDDYESWNSIDDQFGYPY